jgi:hypothetical protein
VVLRSRKALSLLKGFDLPDRFQCVSLAGPQLKDQSPREPRKVKMVKGTDLEETNNPLEIKLPTFLSSFPPSFDEFAIPSTGYPLLYKSLDMLWRGGIPRDELNFGFGGSNGGHLS